jgi:hypothetical protein
MKKIQFLKSHLGYRLAVLAILILIVPACKTKSGCPANADMAPKQNRKGEYKAKKSKASSGLFPGNVKKKVGVKG